MKACFQLLLIAVFAAILCLPPNRPLNGDSSHPRGRRPGGETDQRVPDFG